MNMHKIVSGFFFIFAMTINFGFFYGDPTNIIEHSSFELFAAIVINLIATVLKLGDKTQLGAVLLATSLVADIQLIASATIWALAEHVFGGLNPESTTAIVSLAGGALLANIVSVILFISDTAKSKR
jgi:putative Ca2+/H+ antiporter (TMEM165/GDT1 family)